MYTNWSDRYLPLNSLHWYPISSVVDYLRKLRITIFTEKNLEISKIPNLKGTNLPASKDIRFPSEKGYICEGVGPWIQKLDMLNLSLYVMVNPSRLNRAYSEYKTVGEAEIYAITAINQLLRDLASGEDNTSTVITQSSFEREYGLTWEEPSLSATTNHISKDTNNKKDNDDKKEKFY